MERPAGIFKRVELIKDQQLRHPAGSDLGQHALHLLYLRQKIRIGAVHHVQQQVRVSRFLQRRLKSINQPVRQIANETHRVGQRHRARSVTQVKLARGGVQRGKKLVCGIGSGFDQGIKERRFPCVGVAHERDRKSVAPVALLALGLPLALDFGQPLLGALDGLTDHAFVEFDLFFPRAAAHASAAGLALQVRPAPHQPG